MNEKSLFGKKVAVLVETEYIYDEIEYYKRRVLELGGELTILSYLWGRESMDLVNDIDNPDRPVTSVHRLTVNQCVTKHDPSEFDVVMCAANYVAVRLREIPPMGSLGSPEKVGSAPSVQFFARAMENKKIVKAAMCHALWLLTPRPDLLQGRRVICHTVVLADVHNAGAVFVPDPSHVVVDDDLVTARSFADVEPYFEAIVNTLIDRSRSTPSADIGETADNIVSALEARLLEAAKNFNPASRPISKAAKGLLDHTLDVAAEVKRITNVELDVASPAKHKPILLVTSKFGTWASELTIVAGVLLKVGYKVKIATEDGSPPHFLSPSLDPHFLDGAWRCSVVSQEERDLALKFLNPACSEHELLKVGNVLDLSQIPKPPQVGDYIKAASLLELYKDALVKGLAIAYEYDGIVIAGGSGAIPGLMADRGLHSLILAFHAFGKPIMGECNGGLALAQTIDPKSGKSILQGRAVTTHSWLDEYQSGWGWVCEFSKDPDVYWRNGKFDFEAYSAAEKWFNPGVSGNPLIDSEEVFTNAAGIGGMFFSPPGTPYSVVVDGHLITCRTTPDGYPGVLAMMAVLDGLPPLTGRLFIDQDETGRHHP